MVLWETTPAVQRLPRRVEVDAKRETEVVLSRAGAGAEAKRVELPEQPDPLVFFLATEGKEREGNLGYEHTFCFGNTNTNVKLHKHHAHLQQLRHVDAVHKTPSEGAIGREVSDTLELFAVSLALPVV